MTMDAEMAVNDGELILDMRGIRKSFPGVRALDGVDFSMRRAEVHALMGENGAGKSTLIKVLTGVHPRDDGEIIFDGESIRPNSPIEARALGISTIYQEVNLIPELSVAENIFLGRQPKRFGRIDWRSIHCQAEDVLKTFGLRIDVEQPLSSYSVAIQQMVAIARAVDVSAKLIIMDEPTSSLDESDVQKLFEIIRKLKADGVSVLFITHFLDQVYQISDRITVLRNVQGNGRLVGVFETASLSRLALIGHMLGRDPDAVAALQHERESHVRGAEGAPFLVAKGLGRKGSVDSFDVDIRHGEVYGLAGLLGSGRTETARLLFGIDRPTTGKISIAGKPVRLSSPAKAVECGIGFCPEDRKTSGIIPGLSVRENIVLAIQKRMTRFGFVSRSKQLEVAEKFIRLLGIMTSGPEQPVETLSGGNQQKVILARWLAMNPRLLILDEPTRGIDVGAKAEVERLIESLADDGMAVVFISSELDEVVRRSHRVAVLRDRKHIAELTGDDIDERTIMRTIASQP